MTIHYKNEYETPRPAIDLTGPDGNAFVLMGLAKRWANQMGLPTEEILNEMQSGDYENLLDVLEERFGDFVDFYR